jgi:phenylacetate-CoA ligase
MSEVSKRLKHIIQHAYANAPAVKEIMDRAGVSPDDVQGVADLDKIPVTSKDRLVELQAADPPFGGFLAVPPTQLKRIYFSPGPLYDPQGSKEDLTQAAAEALEAAGWGPGDIVLNSLSYHLVPAGLLLDEALTALGITVIPGGVGMSQLQVKMMLDLQVTGYVGTPSFLATLIEEAKKMGADTKRPLDFKEAFALRSALVTAEPLPPSLRQRFEEEYGIKVVNAYGTADLGLLGYECSAGSGFHVPGGLIVQVVDPETGASLGPGAVGEIVATTFNETYPLIRFGTGDLAFYTDEACACGRSSKRLVALVGRAGEAVKVRGMFVHPNQVRFAIGNFPAVARTQAVVTRPEHRDELVFRVELADENVDRDQLATALGEALRAACRVKADRIEFVEPGTIPSGAKVILDQRTWD